MTDLITLIKNAIERAQQRDRSGRIDAQSTAESVALAIEFVGWKSPEEVEDALLNEAEGLRSHMREGGY